MWLARSSKGSRRPFEHIRAFSLALALAGLGNVGCSSVEYADTTSQANPLDAFESALIGQLNDFRGSKGLAILKPCATLNKSASQHSDDMRDKGYLADTSPEGTKPPDRACSAGFSAACGGKIAMSELLAKGFAEGTDTFDQWNKDATSAPIMVDPQFVVVGIGRSLGGESALWTMDLAGSDDPSCTSAAP